MESLRHLLCAASSQDPRNFAAAEQQLKSLERQSGFHLALLTSAADRTLDPAARMQAILYMKNGIDKHWRKNSPNAIQEAEKVDIRRCLLQNFGDEPIFQIALQVAVVVGKIARFDVPRDWPDLLSALVEAIRIDDSLVQHRALLVLHHTIKALSTKRLAADRKIFHDMIEQLLPYVFSIWEVHHGRFIQSLSNVTAEQAAVMDANMVSSLTGNLEKALLSLKVLRKCLVHGLKKPRENSTAMGLLKTLNEQVAVVLPIRNVRPEWRELLEKYSVLHLKVMADILESHPFSFLPVMKETLSVICSLCFTNQGQGLLFQRFVIVCFNVVKQTLLCPEFRLPKHAEDMTKCPTYEGHWLKNQFFQDATVAEMCKCLVRDYLPLTKEDLEMWDTDPEQYVCEEGGDSWKYSYRPCCEALFLTLFHEYRGSLAPLLVDMVRSMSGPVSGQDLAGLLHKDSVYTAVGLAAFDLYDEIDFDGWLVNGLEQELVNKEPNYRVVRRRAAWLVGQWSGVKLSADLRPKLYQLLVPLLGRDEDLVVRLAASKAIKVVIDDFEFTTDELKPYLSAAFSQLFDLLKEVDECDTKLSVLNVLSYVIERVGTAIRSMCEELSLYLPSLWAASEDHNMLRCSIISTLVFIVQGLGTITESLAPFLHAVISLATRLVDNPCCVYLLEDGLELWLVAVQNSRQLLPQWMQLTANIPPILELGSENLRTMLYIVQAYMVLSPAEFITECGSAICAPLEDQFSDLLDEGVVLILRLVDTALKIGPPQTCHIFKSLILRSFRGVHDGTAYPMIMSLHLSIVSRVFLSNQALFDEFVVEVGRGADKSRDEAAGHIVDVWIDKMPCVSQLDRRKLLAVALATLMGLACPLAVDRVYGIFLNVTETLNDVIRQESDSSDLIDSLLNANDDNNGNDDVAGWETEHERRKRELNKLDVVHVVDLRQLFQANVKNLYNQLGDTRYAEIMKNVDMETMRNMQDYISV